MKYFIGLVLFVVVSLPQLAGAQEEEKDDGQLNWTTVLVPRINPLGLIMANSVAYKYNLYDSESAVLENNFASVAVQPWISPGWFRPGLKLEIQPASIANLSATYEYIFHFGTFGLLQSFASPDADYSDDDLDVNEEAGLNYTPVGRQLTLAGLLQAKVWQIAVRNNFKLLHTNYDLRDGDTVFYDQVVDLLLPGQGWSYVDDVDLLWVTDFGLVAGLRYTVSNAFYGEGEPNPNGPTHRLGPLVTYKFYDQPDELLSEVTGILLANWWLKHRYRQGQQVSQAVPYLAIGVRASGRFF